MKFVSIFTKIPQYKRFNYEPRFYDERADEMKEREHRIRKEIEAERKQVPDIAETDLTIDAGYRDRIAGSFKSSRRTASRQSDPSAALIRLVILLFLTVLLIAYLQFGAKAAYGLVIIIPIYGYLKLRGLRKPGGGQ